MTMSMTSSKDQRLNEVLRNALERKGVLSELKSRLRAEMFHLIDDCKGLPQTSHGLRRPPENQLIDELIREYLLFNNYKYSSSVFQSESGLSDVALDKRFISDELNLSQTDATKEVPLLYLAISKLKASGEEAA